MRACVLPLALALFVSCRGRHDDTAVDTSVDPLPPVDADADGFSDTVDCDDEDAAVYPQAPERCNGIDDNCDGQVDEADEGNDGTWYTDADGDGYGVDTLVLHDCAAPAGAVAAAGDCDDANEAIHPSAPEEDCTDPVDYNCDGLVGWADTDGDGFAACEECDDSNAMVSPGATELPYNGLDDDCDATSLDDDLDGDGFPKATDCDDALASVSPGQSELPYNGVDDDCDANTPDDDLDGDGFLLADDCDDRDARTSPDATEFPYNGLDDDCDANTPDDDLDGDGFLLANDCNDRAAAISPATPETPYNGLDDDCDPSTPDDDLDGDGFPKALDCDDTRADIHLLRDEIPYNGLDDDCRTSTPDDDLDGDGFLLADDCDDLRAQTHPSATETWYDGIDDDCLGDDDFDQDGDGGRAYAYGGSDCDDTDPAVQDCGVTPGSAVETCEVLHRIAPSLPTGHYWLDPDRSGAFQAWCEMDLAGGGWTLVSNRRAGSVNTEACGANIAEFFTAGCGDVTAISAADSFAYDAATRARLPRTQFMVTQYLSNALDDDDAYVVDYAGEMFPNSVNALNIPVARVCDLTGANCDTTDVFWKYVGDFWYANSLCTSGSSNSTNYRGNYGLCHNGADNSNTIGYHSSSFTGSRSAYAETKLWGLPSASNDYQERVWVR